MTNTPTNRATVSTCVDSTNGQTQSDSWSAVLHAWQWSHSAIGMKQGRFVARFDGLVPPLVTVTRGCARGVLLRLGFIADSEA